MGKGMNAAIRVRLWYESHAARTNGNGLTDSKENERNHS